MLQAGITPIDTRNDADGRELFHPLSPYQAYRGKAGGNDVADAEDWYKNMAVTSKEGLECCSARSVSFHYITSPDDIYCLDYLLHHNI